MFEVVGLDPSDPLAVVGDLGPRLDQRVKHDVAVEVDNTDAGQSVSLLGLDALAVKSEDFGFPKQRKLELKTYLPRLRP